MLCQQVTLFFSFLECYLWLLPRVPGLDSILIHTISVSILWQVHQNHQAANFWLIRSWLYRGCESISSEKWGETRISLLPNPEWLKNLAICKNMQAVQTDKACLWITLPYNSHLTLLSFLCHCYEDCKVDNRAICKLNKMVFISCYSNISICFSLSALGISETTYFLGSR